MDRVRQQEAGSGTAQARIRFSRISKAFPGVRALKAVSLDVAAGSCHALVGENGAGKSTLGKILCGLLAPDRGRLLLDGVAVRLRDARAAADAGIGMVHQELLFCENMTVAENLCLDHLPRHGPFLSRKRLKAIAGARLSRLASDLDPDTPIGALSISQQQVVQIAAAVGRGARILVFDEPTSSLSGEEAENLFALMQQLQADGVTMLYVSHRLEEIFRVADTVTVLRDGEQVATRPIETCDKNTLVSLMIGRSLDTYFPGHLDSKPGKTLLRVTGLSSPGKFSDITFELHAGEILGLAGLVGSGRTEVAEALFGLDPHTTGRVEIRDEPVAIAGARSMRRMGMGLVPEDRKRHGLVLGMTARENISLPLLDRLSRLGWIRRGMEKALVQRYFERLRVRARSVDAPAYSLSGGNQQKLIMARWLAASCSILLVDEPTRGVDVGAKAEIHALLDDLARQGAGLLLISSELPEILNLSSRILVLRRGRLVGEVARAGASQESVMRLMAGITPAGTS